jgi:hypothetical protein
LKTWAESRSGAEKIKQQAGNEQGSSGRFSLITCLFFCPESHFFYILLSKNAFFQTLNAENTQMQKANAFLFYAIAVL